METARRAENHSLHERGIALVLCFLVLVILICVIASVVTVSNVDYSLSVNAQHALQAEAAERAAFAKAEALLLLDLSQHEVSAASELTADFADAADTTQPLAISATAASMAGPGGNPAGNDSPHASAQPSGLSDDDSAASATSSVSSKPDTAVPAAVDSWLDAWADPSLTRIECGDVTAQLAIVDEDSKLNLLGLLAEDAAEHERNRDRIIRVIDLCRESTSHDISLSEAITIADGIERHMRGERDREHLPRPKPASLDTDASAESGPILPISMEEFVAVRGITEDRLHGFIEDSEVVLGLEDVLTIWSSLMFDEMAYAGVDEPFVWEFMKLQPGYKADKAKKDARERALSTTQNNFGRVNVNTAPAEVLAALVPEGTVPWSAFEQIERYRRGEADRHGGRVGGRVFTSSAGALSIASDAFGTEPEIEADVAAEFNVAVTTSSHVFRVCVTVERTPGTGPNEGHGMDEAGGRAQRGRFSAAIHKSSLFWRCVDDSGEGRIVRVTPSRGCACVGPARARRRTVGSGE